MKIERKEDNRAIRNNENLESKKKERQKEREKKGTKK